MLSTVTLLLVTNTLQSFAPKFKKRAITYPHFWLHKSGIDVPPQLKEGAFMWDIPPATGWHVHIASCRIVGVMPWLDGTNEMNNFHISSKPEGIEKRWVS